MKDDIHSCSIYCPRPECIAARKAEQKLKQLAILGQEIDAAKPSDMVLELRRKLQECRSSVKFDYNSFDRLVMRKEQDGSINQVDRDELKRIGDLLDYIDALPDTNTTERTESGADTVQGDSTQAKIAEAYTRGRADGWEAAKKKYATHPQQQAERVPLIFPEHKCGLFLSHNEHRDYYENLEQFIVDQKLAEYFESPEAMQQSIDTDELWVLQWYPNTPVGFNIVAGPTLDGVLVRALSYGIGITAPKQG